MGASTSRKKNNTNNEDGKTFQTNKDEQISTNVENHNPVGKTNDAQTSPVTCQHCIDEARLGKLMSALQRFAIIGREAASFQIDSREKRREAMFKRRDVWIWDDKFMGEMQRLMAEGKLTAFPELTRLGNICQGMRDDLGLVEQENIEAEQRWESQMWRLQQASEDLRTEFQHEFEDAEGYSHTTTDSIRSKYEPSCDESQDHDSELEIFASDDMINYDAASAIGSPSSQFYPHPTVPVELHDSVTKESILAELMLSGGEQSDTSDTLESDVGTENIEGPLELLPASGPLGPSISLPKRNYASLEYYPQLLTDFSSGRDRINKWLQDITLTSRVEGLTVFSGLQIQFEADKRTIPSNWAQLTMAFWDLDGAAIPRYLTNKGDVEKKMDWWKDYATKDGQI